MQTVWQLKVGTVFRKWDGDIYRLAEKSESRAILDPGRWEVSLGTEVLEVLPESAFATHEEGETEMANLAKDKQGHVTGPVRISICQDKNCELIKPGETFTGKGWPKKCENCHGPVSLTGVGCENGEVKLIFKDGVLVGIDHPKETPKVPKANGGAAEKKPSPDALPPTSFTKDQQLGKAATKEKSQKQNEVK